MKFYSLVLYCLVPTLTWQPPPCDQCAYVGVLLV